MRMKPSWLTAVLVALTLSPLGAQIPPTPGPNPPPPKALPTPRPHPKFPLPAHSGIKPTNPEFGAALPPQEYYLRLSRRLAADWGIPKRKATKGEKIWGAVGQTAGYACAGVAAYQAIQALADHAKRK